MAYLDDLRTQRTNLMAALTSATVNPQPNHSVASKNGTESVSSADYIAMLTEQIGALNKLIVAASPAILVNRGYYNG